ncbi:hypothetical protein J7J47_02300 [Halomonas sp. ISL-60]|uniref:hypothetical protein n=1 Tax=Halomonas sp. ISL-56 TaxID=2819149 RepID=UPI001BE6D0F4|nr:hypothetical protein [Halomonas sp. ISL-56]MBT2771061.1 hypothetical protein [Halomonas sp. ISL-60]MBT2801954.1 hypothetical protein [Halomonas sp. ISL-56]
MFSQSIKVKEYTSSSIKGGATKGIPIKIIDSASVHGALKVNFLKFSVAMLKANTKSNSSAFSQAYDIMLNALFLYGLLDCKNSSICLKNGFRDKYRDFSRSSRTGELGQAINYIFSQEFLGYKYVFDFDEFLSVYSIASKKSGGTPDYVLLGKKNKNVSVLESKGSSALKELTRPELRSRLQKAMDNQCLSGVVYLQKNKVKVSNSYASVVEFSETTESRDSFIHFADPEYDEFKEQSYSEALKNFYTRWIAFLLGRQDNDSVDIGKIKLSEYFDVREYQGEQYYVQNKSYSNLNLIVPVFYGISSRVFNHILAEEYDYLYYLEMKALSLENVEIFSDGTIAIGVN